MDYQIELGSNWRLYANHFPVGTTPLGVIREPDGQAGALVRVQAADYPGCRDTLCRVNGGCYSSLDQRVATEALARAASV